ncbi:hypothetical protein BCV72DRAFT_295655 [Rhizopus microsporus var. microsporus]|uniref:Arrestin C-terminal-like domain-containing protein n=1 Tax=Rhizopus microsporus var. microsporus TaxID=86635 RepID=A0A1X0QVS6_RHIZD|nr:hypothetical protein BCV72DRAFT_295655 [Rhizopus microsporus var. microsporus]
MIFSKVFKPNPIQTFEVNICSGVENNAIAFGPGSIINGNVKLFLDKPVKTKYIKIIFTCQEKKDSVTLFSVESNIWNSKQDEGEVLESGAHLYLFAIQLPSNVNYPPTIRDDSLGHRIEYSLQGFIYLSDQTSKSTNCLPLTYLPLVAVKTNAASENKTVKIERGDEFVLVTAALVNPYLCPVTIQLISTTTSLKNNTGPIASTGPSYHHKRHEILSESQYVSIPKHTQQNNSLTTSICTIQIPSTCVPTTQTHFASKYIDIQYEIIIFIPAFGHHSLNDTKFIAAHPNCIRLPLVITTVPSTIPTLQIPFAVGSNNDDSLPTFIPYIESPSPSPTSPIYQQWGPGSPVEPSDEDYLYPSSPIEDASGHLMVPSTSPTRSLSIKSA